MTAEPQWDFLATALQHGLHRFRWYGSKSRAIKSVKILQRTPLPETSYFLALAKIEYSEGAPETYALPVAFADPKKAARIARRSPKAVFWRGADGSIAYDATEEPLFRSGLLKFILSESRLKTDHSVFCSSLTDAYDGRIKAPSKPGASRVLKAEQSNTSIAYGTRFVLKLYRKLGEGVNPDVEIGRFLTDSTRFRSSPPVVGTLELDPRRKGHEPITIGCVYEFVGNDGNAWQVFLKELSRLTRSASRLKHEQIARIPAPALDLLAAAARPIPGAVERQFSPLLKHASLLGRRTAEMHEALGSGRLNSGFSRSRVQPRTRREMTTGLHRHADLAFHILRNSLTKLDPSARKEALRLLELRDLVHKKLDNASKSLAGAETTRTHGDYHLGQVLFTGKDFVIIDYEGEPARPLEERRRKHPPERDIAGMLRSFHYAAQMARTAAGSSGERLGIWFSLWNQWVSVAFLKGYLGASSRGATGRTAALLQLYLIEKALYELVYELNNRPDWVKVPLSGILELLEA